MPSCAVSVAHVSVRGPVHIAIGSGRRWIARHPERRFDLIVMNTTYYWKNLSTRVLSREFLELVRSRLTEGGIVCFNSTGYESSFFTAARVFTHVTAIEDFVVAGDRPLDVIPDRLRARLSALRLDDAPVFRPDDPESADVMHRLSAADLPELGPAYRSRDDLLETTDDNMAPEYRVDSPTFSALFDSDKSWRVLWNR